MCGEQNAPQQGGGSFRDFTLMQGSNFQSKVLAGIAGIPCTSPPLIQCALLLQHPHFQQAADTTVPANLIGYCE